MNLEISQYENINNLQGVKISALNNKNRELSK